MDNLFVKYFVSRVISSKVLEKLSGAERHYFDLLLLEMEKGTNEVVISGELSSGEKMCKSRQTMIDYKKALMREDIIRKGKHKRYMINPLIANCANSRKDGQALQILLSIWEKLK